MSRVISGWTRISLQIEFLEFHCLPFGYIWRLHYICFYSFSAITTIHRYSFPCNLLQSDMDGYSFVFLDNLWVSFLIYNLVSHIVASSLRLPRSKIVFFSWFTFLFGFSSPSPLVLLDVFCLHFLVFLHIH